MQTKVITEWQNRCYALLGIDLRYGSPGEPLFTNASERAPIVWYELRGSAFCKAENVSNESPRELDPTLHFLESAQISFSASSLRYPPGLH